VKTWDPLGPEMSGVDWIATAVVLVSEEIMKQKFTICTCDWLEPCTTNKDITALVNLPAT